MSVEKKSWVRQPDRSGALIIHAVDFYSMFQTFPGAGSMGDEGGIFSYGLITTHDSDAEPAGWLLDRVSDEGRLIPRAASRLHLQMHSNTLVVDENRVDAVLERFQAIPSAEDRLPVSTIAAERLYRRVAGQILGNEMIEACATYSVGAGGARFAYVNQQGGFSVGLPAANEHNGVLTAVAAEALAGMEYTAA